MPGLHIATFAADVTPPEGHPLCGGWIEPVRGVDDPLEAVGVVLTGAGKPVVLCSIDWTGLRNEAYLTWRAALADAAGTTPDRVAVQCVHPHNTPFADTGAQKILAATGEHAPILDLKFFDAAVRRCADAVRAAAGRGVPFTHVGVGQARVEKVASNRRVIDPETGKWRGGRTSATKDEKLRAEPEGLIDPFLKTLSFWDGARPLAALSYYATHPMSYYGDGRVSADFCGLARRQRQAESKLFQVYFNGCGGNVTAGKYNDGAKENRAVLRDRVVAGMRGAWRATKTFPADTFDWRVRPVKLPPRAEAFFGEADSRKRMEDHAQKPAARNNAAFHLAWLARLATPIDVTCLDFGGKALAVHLPGEPFVEYQLRAQALRPDAFVCVAGYGDDGTGYLPTAAAYLEGGYEPTVALTAPEGEGVLTAALTKLLQTGTD